MKVFSVFMLLVLGCCTKCLAQKSSGKSGISGIVNDSISGKPLRQASVSLLTDRDSAYVAATITDGDGKFQIKNVAQGHYRLLISFVGYRNVSRFVKVMHDLPVNAGMIRMSAQVNLLDELTVKQERPPVTIRQDTVEFNADAFKTQPNAQVEELLRKLPGLEVARDGSIRANGEAVGKVLVDGKPFFGNDPKMATRNLPADIVERVQVYDQSSDQSQFSGIDDGNRERTINLTIKRDKGKGYFGQNSAGAGPGLDPGALRYQGKLSLNRFNNGRGGPGRQLSVVGQANNLNQQNFTQGDAGSGPVLVGGPGGGGAAGNQTPTNMIAIKAAGVNYRTEGSRLRWGKRNEFSGSYFANQATTVTDQQIHRENILSGNSLFTGQDNYSKNRQTTHRFNGRLDFQPDSLSTLRLTPNISWQTARYNSHSKSGSYRTTGDSLNAADTRYHANGTDLKGFNNLLFMRKFSREGRLFSANLNTIFSDGETNAHNASTNAFYDSSGTNPPTTDRLNQRNLQDGRSVQNTVALSFTEPLSLSRKFEFRYAYGNSRNSANRHVADLGESGPFEEKKNELLSNRFSSSFETQQLGMTFQTRRLRYSYAFGFDLQKAGLQTNDRSADTTKSRTYLTVLPNVLFSYTFSGNRSLRLQYRTRLSPPSVSQLQPVVDNTSPLNIRLGNPALRPEFYNTATLTYNGMATSSGRSLFLFASLNQSNHRIGTSTNTGSNGAQTTQPVNTSGYWSANGFLSVSRSIQPIKMTVNLTTNAHMVSSCGLVNGRSNSARNRTVGQGIRLQSSYNGKIDYGFSATVSYQSVAYSLLTRQNTSFWSKYATADLHWDLPRQWVVSSDFTYTANSGRSTGYNQSFALWNIALARPFLKGKQGEIRLQVFDLLNQNRSLVRNTGDAYIEDIQSRVLNRYFTISFVYNLRRFGV